VPRLDSEAADTNPTGWLQAKAPASSAADQQPTADRLPTTPVPQRPSAPSAIPQSGARTGQMVAQRSDGSSPRHPPPDAAAMSGSRTAPRLDANLDARTTAVAVSKSEILHEDKIAAVLDDLEPRTVAPVRWSTPRARVPDAPRRFEPADFLLSLLVLIAAGAAAAVVYFALPYLS
jgi:hypothetical protein